MKRLTNIFKGMGVAMVTPFNDDLSIDYKALELHTEFLIEGGANYLVVLGTTAETPTLTTEEKDRIVRCIVQKTNKRIPIMLGLSDNSTSRLLDELRTFNLEGIDAILSACPFYNKPTQRGLIAHFKTIADKSSLPILLYNVPGRTGVNLLPETVVALSNHANIFGIKEASGNLDQMKELIIKLKDKEPFLVISGDDGLTLPLIQIGGHGVISVIANAYPKSWTTLVTSAIEHDFINADILQNKFNATIDAIFANGNPAGIKALLYEMGRCKNTLRLPLVPVEDKIQVLIKNLCLENE